MVSYKEPQYNKKGQPICEICKVGYDRVLQHANQRHGINAAEYKAKYGYHSRKGIQSKVLQKKMHENALKNYNKVIMDNLIIAGQGTRFKEGNTATDKELVSKLNKERMKAYWASKRESKQELISRLTHILNPRT